MPSSTPSTSTTKTATKTRVPVARTAKTRARVAAKASPAPGVLDAQAAGQVASDFLARELAAAPGGILQSFGYPDVGLTIDAILALDAAGVGQDSAAAATTAVAGSLGSYLGPDFGDELYAGATAKALLLAIAQGQDPTTFGGFDLPTLLDGREQENGRYTDLSQWGDYSNTIGQSLAIIALGRYDGTYSQAAVDFLLAQQCTDGGFRIDPDAEGCASDVDATAFAVQALVLALGDSDPDVARAMDYLAALVSSEAAVLQNANSAGLTAQALFLGGRLDEALTLMNFLMDLQLLCDAGDAVQGAITFDPIAYDERLGQGAAATSTDQDRRATAQAVYGLGGVSLLDVTSDGAIQGTPALDCTTPTPTATPPVTPSVSPTAELAETGAGDSLTIAAVGGFLLAIGGALVVAGRPAHRRRH